MVFAEARLATPFHDTVFCTDACLSGYGIMQPRLPVDTVRSLCSQDERWRFLEHPTGFCHRASALGVPADADPFLDVSTVCSGVKSERVLHEDFSFPAVSDSLLNVDDWDFDMAGPLRFHEPVYICETRGVLASVKMLSRDANSHCTRFVGLGDNLGLELALSKGRCSSRPLLRILQRIGAERLAAGLSMHRRWLPSERNVADACTRLWEQARLRRHGIAGGAVLGHVPRPKSGAAPRSAAALSRPRSELVSSSSERGGLCSVHLARPAHAGHRGPASKFSSSESAGDRGAGARGGSGHGCDGANRARVLAMWCFDPCAESPSRRLARHV